MFVVQAKTRHRTTAQGVRGVLSRTEPKSRGCDSKKFFFIKIPRSVCGDWVGIALRGRVVRRLVIVSEITVPRCRSLLLAE